MPELPEVEVVRQQLHAHVVGATIRNVWIGRDDIVRQGLGHLPWFLGARLSDVRRQGKSLAMVCQHGQERRYMVAELGMTGLLLFDRRSVPSEKHLHMVLALSHARQGALHYWNARRFGRLHALDEMGWDAYRRRRWGVDPLTVSANDFLALIKGCRGRVKALLLNQQRIAGIGNIYANEMLFHAGIHPHAHGCRLSKKRIHLLFEAMQRVLIEAIHQGGSSIRDFLAPDGSPGQFQNRHLVYQKTGKPCPHGCPTLIRRLVTERSSFFCPTCQRR